LKRRRRRWQGMDLVAKRLKGMVNRRLAVP
jgi:hypothetical protein